MNFNNLISLFLSTGESLPLLFDIRSRPPTDCNRICAVMTQEGGLKEDLIH